MVKPQGRETAPEPGFQSLTDREADMLVLIAAGRTDRQIAASLRLSENTVSTYVTRLLVKFGAANRAELTDDPGAPTVTAHMLSQSRSRTLDLLASGSWRTRTITTYYDGDARVTAVDDNPQGSAETCTATSYATPPAGNAMMLSYPKQVTTVTGAASSGSCPAASSSGIVSATRYYYDDESATLTSMGTLGSLASPGGLVTGVVKAVTWPAGGSEQWVPQSVSVYDAYGRVTSVTDARGKATGTSYSPAGVLPTSVTVTNPKTWTTVTQLDQGRQLPVKVTDVNGEVTSETYDALGRLTSVTQPIDQNTGYPTDKFTYYVTGTSPPVVEARTLRQDGSYGVKHSIYDGMGQLR